MSLPWIKVFKDLPEHPKSDTLSALLGEDRAWTYMVQLWFWVAKSRPDGDLSNIPDDMIANRAGWRGDAKKFVAAVVESGFLDGDEFFRSVHNWSFYQEKHAKRRESDKLSKRQKRAEQKNRVLPTVLPTVSATVAATVDATVLPSVGALEKRRGEEENKNLVLFAAATSEKAPRGRPPKETPEIVVDRERWLAKARALVGLTPEETPPSGAFCVLFAKTRKLRGMDQLMRALEGLEGDQWAKSQGLQTLLSSALIEKGLAKANRHANTVGIGFDETWDRYAKEAGLVGE